MPINTQVINTYMTCGPWGLCLWGALWWSSQSNKAIDKVIDLNSSCRKLRRSCLGRGVILVMLISAPLKVVMFNRTSAYCARPRRMLAIAASRHLILLLSATCDDITASLTVSIKFFTI